MKRSGMRGSVKVFRFIFIAIVLVLEGSSALAQVPNNNDMSACPAPLLSKIKRHRIIEGETVSSIAEQYGLLPETLVKFNPNIKVPKIPVGQEIFIPPINGVKIEAPPGSTWLDLEGAYGVRADILFELNGCQKRPKVVFIPGTSWAAKTPQKDYTGLAGYPLPTPLTVGLSYGWQNSPIQKERLFHSGIDLLAPVGTDVLAADDGLVIYVDREGAYGNYIIINHRGNRQTRYAHLASVAVKVNQRVKTGEIIGTVGQTGQPDISAPHLHFEVRFKTNQGWVAQDPAIHLKIKR
ncbi:MAG: hypothetical protein N5P05_002987 [Chroococcopsis gigantea SAG 12.99]|nr:M23 family metallopeptidase [Chlorogloea purpurea SAG 13.99]MDV3001381.1 hypothetical protein [Chroococcopsis gigantea SAG 12.99]